MKYFNKQNILFFLLVAVFVLPNFAEAALVYVGGNKAAGTNASYNVSLTALTGGLSSTAAAGDLVIVGAGHGGTADGNPGVGTAGYTEINDLFANDSVDANFSLNYKFMTGTPDTVVSCNGSGVATDAATCAVHVWRYVDSTTPFDTASTSGTGTNTGVPNSPSITPVTSGAVVISAGLGASAASITAVTAPTGYSNTVSSVPASDPGNISRIGLASKAWTSGAEDPAAWTGFDTTNTGSWGAFTLALRPAVLPTVTTQSASSITTTTATANGNITSTGGISPTVRGFAYGTSATLATAATTTENGTFSLGAFTAALSSLTCNTTYYTRAYASSTVGIGYGSITSFTSSPCLPTVTTQSASSIGETSATFNGNITSTGGENATVRGFAYGTSATLAADGTATTTENGSFSTGAFTDATASLSCNTTYYTRAYATNSAGTNYGAISSSLTTSGCSNVLGDGTDGSNSSIGPGGATTEIDRFTFVTSNGTDTVTGLTVTMDGNSDAYTNIATVAVQTTGGVTKCSATPSSNTVLLTSCGITVTTSLTEYKIMITPKTHANMPAVPGASYATTATVTSVTSTNPNTGADSDSATVTIDNQSPSGAVLANVTPGTSQNSIFWNNPIDSDFQSTLVLRATSTISVSPFEGSTYATSTTIGASVVVCVGNINTCIDTGLTNGTAYYYKIFTRDSNGNFSAIGVEPSGSPATPISSGEVNQLHYRWRYDTGSESSADYASAEDSTVVTETLVGDRMRLRFLISATSGTASEYNYLLEISSTTCTTWSSVGNTTGGSDHWTLDYTPYLLDGDFTTNLSGLTDPIGGSFVTGFTQTYSNPGYPVSLNSGQFTELEYSLHSTSNAVAGITYCFRLTNNGSVTGFTHAVTPSIVLSTGIHVQLGDGNGGGGANSVRRGAGGEMSSTPNAEVNGGGNGGGVGNGSGGEGDNGGGSGTGGGSTGGGGGDIGYFINREMFYNAIPTFYT